MSHYEYLEPLDVSFATEVGFFNISPRVFVCGFLPVDYFGSSDSSVPTTWIMVDGQWRAAIVASPV